MTQRAPVTVLFVDLVGSTALLSRLGDHAYDEIRRDVFAALRAPVRQLGGDEVKNQGDGLMVAFRGRAVDAVVCGVAMQQAIARLAARDPSLALAIRVGVASGEATFEDGDWFGTPVVEAARLCGVAAPEQVLVTGAVLDGAGVARNFEFHPFGEIPLKGFPDPTPTFSVVWTPDLPLDEFPRPPLLDVSGALAFVGRAEPRGRISSWLDEAARGDSVTVLVCGEAGAGATRLCVEAIRETAPPETVVLVGSCQGRPFDAWIELVRWYAIAAEAAHLAALIDAATLPAAQLVPMFAARVPGIADEVAALGEIEADELIDALATLVGRIAQRHDLIVFIDDLHLAHPLTLDLLAAMALAPGLRNVALLATFRIDADRDPEGPLAHFLDKLAANDRVHTLELGPVNVVAVATLLEASGADANPDTVFAATAGNPARVVGAIRRLLGDTPAETALALAAPYKGLVGFGTDDAPVYFGRERAVATLDDRLASERFVAIIGASGSGKSSLVAAGHGGSRRALYPDSPEIRRIVPGSDPLATLASVLDELGGVATAEVAGELVFIDQFEQCITRAPLEDAREFADRVAGLIGDRSGPSVVIAIRADFLGEIANLSADLAVRIESGALLLGPMTTHDLAATVTGPAAAAGLRLESGLVELAVSEVAGEPGALPLLSHAMFETWRRRHGNLLTIADYREAGGARGAIARTADACFVALDARGQHIARELFVRLCEVRDGVADTGRRVEIPELATIAPGAQDLHSVMDPVVDARLVTVDHAGVELAHEALVREWDRLRGWLAEDQERLRAERAIARRAREWDRLGRPDAELLRGTRLAQAIDPASGLILGPFEREYVDRSDLAHAGEQRAVIRQARRLRRLLRAVVVLLAIASLAGITAFVQRGKADDRASEARRQTQVAQRETAKARIASLTAQSRARAPFDRSTALLLAAEAFSQQDSVDTRSALLDAVRGDAQLLGFLTGPTSGYRSIALTDDGSRLVASGADGTDIWDLARRERTASIDTGPVVTAALSGARYLVATGEATEIWDLESGKRVTSLPIVAASVDAAGDNGLIGGVDGSLTHIDLSDGATLARTAQGSTPVVVALGPNREVAAASREPDGFRLTTVTVRGPDLVVTWTVPGIDTQDVTDLAFAPTGDVLAIGTNTQADPIVLNTITQTTVGRVQIRPEIGRSASTVAVSRNGVVFSTGATGIVSTFPLDQTFAAIDYVGGVGALGSIALSADGSRVWAAGGTAVGWSLSGDDSLGGAPFGPGSDPVAFSRDGERLLVRGFSSNSSGRTAQLFTLDAREAIGAPVAGEPIGFSDDDLAVVRSGDDVVLLDRFGTEVDRFTVQGVERLVISQSGTRLAGVVTATGSVSIIDVHGAGQVTTVEGTTGEPVGVTQFADDAETIAIARPAAGRVDVVELTSGQQTATISITDEQGTALAFGPRHEALAVGALDGSTTLFSLAGGKPTRTITGPNGPVGGLRFTDDGSVLVVAAADGTVRRIDVESGTAIGGAFPYSGVQSTVVVDAASSRLAGANGFGILVFDLDADVWNAQACRLAGANLTLDEWSEFLGDLEPRATCAEHPPPS